MFFEAEDVTFVEADAFEDTVAIEEAMVKDGHFGVRLRVKLTINVNFHKILE
jgi:hypothetical protein